MELFFSQSICEPSTGLHSSHTASFPAAAIIGNTDNRKEVGMTLALHNVVISSC